MQRILGTLVIHMWSFPGLGNAPNNHPSVCLILLLSLLGAGPKLLILAMSLWQRWEKGILEQGHKLSTDLC